MRLVTSHYFIQKVLKIQQIAEKPTTDTILLEADTNCTATTWITIRQYPTAMNFDIVTTQCKAGIKINVISCQILM